MNDQDIVLYVQVVHQRKPQSSHCSDQALECEALKNLICLKL